MLGAPLTHDFAVVSLSDLLTPWEKITARLTAAAQADFVLCLYNPASHSRPDYLQRACDILLSAGKDPATVCGTVRNIGDEEGHDVNGIKRLRGGHVHHRVRRQQPDQGDRRKDGDPPGLSPAGGIGKYARRRRA